MACEDFHQENLLDGEFSYEKSDGMEDNVAVTSCIGEGPTSDSNSPGDMLAEKETRLVNYLRLGVLLFLLLSAGVIAFAVHHYTTAIQQNEFKLAVNNYATKAVEALQANTERQLMALDSLATYMTMSAKTANATWPFFVVPSFPLLARNTLAEVQALSMLTNTVVRERERAEWNEFALSNHAAWKKADLAFQASGGYNKALANSSQQEEGAENVEDTRSLKDGEALEWTKEVVDTSNGIGSDIYVWETKDDGTQLNVPAPIGEHYYFPLWQNSPAMENFIENLNAPNGLEYLNCIYNHTAFTGQSWNTQGGFLTTITDVLLALWGRSSDATEGDPLGSYTYPVHEELDRKSRVVSTLTMYIYWTQLFANLLPPDAVGITAVLENTCGQVLSYEINGGSARYLGEVDSHDARYDYLVHSTELTSYFNEHRSKFYYGVDLTSDVGCQYTLRVYPSSTLEDTYKSSFPVVATVVVLVIFVFAIAVFVAYDVFVEMRQRLVMRNALQSGAIVAQMFPSVFRDRLMAEERTNTRTTTKHMRAYLSHKGHIKSFLDGGGSDEAGHESKPLADLFPDTTVMFADIANFTSWASQRHPEQVFFLLQSIYQAFDAVAKQRKVWKVETVGDSYVAVAGIPDAQPENAVIMACFAQSCLHKFIEVTRQLDTTLGPDTSELKIRFGLHSGPCTAGVLRGDRSRFQLFGDTVNMAARMESSGVPNRIQISKTTATLLEAAGRAHWLTPRSEEVNIKGKGYVQTYFVHVKGVKSVVSHTTSISDTSFFGDATKKDLVNHTSTKKKMRLIEWNVKTLADRLRAICARRTAVVGKRKSFAEETVFVRQGKTCLDEMTEVIYMPAFDPKAAAKESDPNEINLGEKVVSQLRLYVTTIASMYHDENTFHNFSHASHVAMSVDKLLKRIVAPDINVDENNMARIGLQLHDYTHGITSDPLTQFAIVYSALVHDVDHQGISNNQLSKENPELAKMYRNKSIAEQNSIDLSWDVLMRNDFCALRNCIYTDKNELNRFRQTVINVVLATDIFDKELNEVRKQRWNNAFSETVSSPDLNTNVKATIVIEHLIQASDVAHTMQHWHVYRKWNERLFVEMMRAYRCNRMSADPSTFWYQGELGFFDNYIIPLARKLEECSVFGVFSHEYLSYAKANREEWEQKGQTIVAELVEKYRVKIGTIDEEDKEAEVELKELMSNDASSCSDATAFKRDSRVQ